MANFKWTLIAVQRNPMRTPALKLTYEGTITTKELNPNYNPAAPSGFKEDRFAQQYTEYLVEPTRVEKIEYLDTPNEDVRAFFASMEAKQP